MKNLIEFWLLQIGEQFINKKNFVKKFEDFNRICLTILAKNAPTEKKLVSKIKNTTSEKPSETSLFQ